MHINNLRNNSLRQYGNVLFYVPNEYEVKIEREFKEDKVIQRFYSESDVVLDYGEGMSCLVIFSDDQPSFFYLDRIVRLNAKVVFSVFPLENSCKISFYIHQRDELREFGKYSIEFTEKDTESLHFGKLYTCFVQDIKTNFYFRGESHSPYELIYLEQGCLHNIIEGQDVVLEPRQCLLVDSNSWHMQYSDDKVRFLTASFDAESDSLKNITNTPLNIQDNQKQILDRLIDEMDEKLYSVDCREAFLTLFLIGLLRQSVVCGTSAKYPATSHAESLLVNKMVQYIADHALNRIDLKRLASDFHISIPYLYTLFNRHIGIPPAKYIMKIKIEESKILLRSGQWTIGGIADQMGFSSIQHFSKQFKQNCGMSPSQFLKNNL